MLDPVVVVCAATTLATLLVFGFIDKPPVWAGLGGGFQGMARAKVLCGGVFALAGVGSIAILGVSLGDAGLGLTNPAGGALWVGGYAAVFGPIVWFNARQPGSWAHSPQLRAESYAGRRWVLVGAWAVYLLAYEFMFRGVLTFVLVAELGRWRGIAVATGLYVLAHLTKRGSEALSTVVVGPLYAMMALVGGGFWPVFVAHLGTALLSEITSARANPEVEF